MASPFIPSHKRRFTAKKVFTDRETPAGLFFAAFEPPPAPDDHRVLVFYGVGGEGKTALARHLLGRLEAAHAGRAGWAAVNFEDAAMRRPAEALLSVRLQLRKTAGLPFPAFDTAFAHWFGKTYPGDDIRHAHPGLFRQGSEPVGDALGYGFDVFKNMDAVLNEAAQDALGQVPGLGLIYKYGNRFHARFREWWERRGKEVLQGIDALQPDQLLDRLPTFLGADIADAIAAMQVRKPLAIIGDTVEAFHRAEGQKAGAFAFRNDRWLRDLVKETPGVLFVLLGKDRLRWAEMEPEWEEVLDQHRLGALLPKDAERHLIYVPVAEPEIRARMVEGAKGLPFYLERQVDLYEGLKNRGLAPEPRQFGGSQPEILARLLDYLGETTTRALTVLAHCRRFDEALWLHLGQAFMGGLAPTLPFGELREFSFVEELEGNWLTLHALMREEMRAHTAKGEPLLHDQVHRCLFAWWDERCQPVDVRSVALEHELALGEAVFHRAMFERETFGRWALERGRPFYEAARYGPAQTLLEATLAIEEVARPKNDRSIAKILHNLGMLLKMKGELDLALNVLARALTLREQEFGPDHPEVATTLTIVGNVYHDMREFDIALTHHRRALEIQEREFGRYDRRITPALANLGTVLQSKGELDPGGEALDEALTCQRRVLQIKKKELSHDDAEISATLSNLGVIFNLKDRPSRAKCLWMMALSNQEKVFDKDHPEIGITLFNLSLAEESLGNLVIAQQHRMRALANYERRLGMHHWRTEKVRQSLEMMGATANGSDTPPHP